jgi:hypothetical protein
MSQAAVEAVLGPDLVAKSSNGPKQLSIKTSAEALLGHEPHKSLRYGATLELVDVSGSSLINAAQLRRLAAYPVMTCCCCCSTGLAACSPGAACPAEQGPCRAPLRAALTTRASAAFAPLQGLKVVYNKADGTLRVSGKYTMQK